jgi:Flp pilus assembly protein TadG
VARRAPVHEDRARGDRGTAVVEFTLVSILLVALFLMILQVGLVLHARNVMVSAAQEGARFAANADRSPADGVARTRAALSTSLGADLVGRTAVTPLPGSTTPSGAPVVGIRVSGPAPWVFRAVGQLTITVEGHALEEARP